jgi:hypothetical protein
MRDHQATEEATFGISRTGYISSGRKNSGVVWEGWENERNGDNQAMQLRILLFMWQLIEIVFGDPLTLTSTILHACKGTDVRTVHYEESWSFRQKEVCILEPMQCEGSFRP